MFTLVNFKKNYISVFAHFYIHVVTLTFKQKVNKLATNSLYVDSIILLGQKAIRFRVKCQSVIEIIHS
jgi:hypothetical protein